MTSKPLWAFDSDGVPWLDNPRRRRKAKSSARWAPRTGGEHRPRIRVTGHTFRLRPHSPWKGRVSAVNPAALTLVGLPVNPRRRRRSMNPRHRVRRRRSPRGRFARAVRAWYRPNRRRRRYARFPNPVRHRRRHHVRGYVQNPRHRRRYRPNLMRRHSAARSHGIAWTRPQTWAPPLLVAASGAVAAEILPRYVAALSSTPQRVLLSQAGVAVLGSMALAALPGFRSWALWWFVGAATPIVVGLIQTYVLPTLGIGAYFYSPSMGAYLYSPSSPAAIAPTAPPAFTPRAPALAAPRGIPSAPWRMAAGRAA